MRDKRSLIGDPQPEGAGGDYSHEQPQSVGRPLVATAIGALVLLLLHSGRSGRRGPETVEAMLGALTAELLIGAIVWAIAFAITIRKSSAGWKIGSLVSLALLSLLLGLAEIGRSSRGSQEESAAEVARGLLNQIDSGDVDRGEFKAGKDPRSQMIAMLFSGVAEDTKAFEQEAESSGMAQVLSFEGLTRRSAVLDRCAGLDALASRGRHYGTRWPDHVAAASQLGNEAVQQGRLSRSALEEFESGFDSSSARFQRQWELNRLMTIEAGGACRVLARRRWEKPGAQVLFYNNKDTSAFNAHVDRIKAYQTEFERNKADSRAEGRRELEAMLR